jgi:6-pyruvoyl-tetrahydropterin synthase related domain
MFFLGNASGHDFGFHVASWLDVAGQWREGTAYPRWAEWANWGMGEPRFIFYPPASWTLGAALGTILPWNMAPGAFIWLVLIFSGFTMWRLARECLPDPQATAAAVIFVVNPYQLAVVYYRSDFAELLASALFPLLILGTLRAIRDGWRQGWSGIPFLAIMFAAIWLSNAPAAVIATYSLALLLAVGCIVQQSLRPLLAGGAAMAFGFGLAGFYILPAAFEQQWVQIAQVVMDDLRPAQNFLFTHSNNPEFALFNWKVSSVALATILLASVAAVFSARYRREYSTLWSMMLALAGASIFLMFPVSVWLWRYLPKLQFVQFPWRWLVPLGVPYSIFLASAIGRSRRRWLLYGALAVVIAAGATAIARDAWWDSEDVTLLAAAIHSSHGYEGTDEYAPIGCDRYSLPGMIADPDSLDAINERPPTPRVAKLDLKSREIVPDGGMQVRVDKWLAEDKIFHIDAAEPVTLALRLLNYPAWEVRVDGEVAASISAPATAQMLVHVPAGSHRIEAVFRRTRDRITGDAISGVSAVLLVAFAILFGRRSRPE